MAIRMEQRGGGVVESGPKKDISEFGASNETR